MKIKKQKSVRLSKNVVQIEYDIQLQPDLENFNFAGIETINLSILTKTQANTLPVSVKEHSAGIDIVRFSPTPKMSSYLLAFVVGDFEYIAKKTKNGVLVRVFSIPGKKHQAKFALDITVRVLEFYEKYFDIP